MMTVGHLPIGSPGAVGAGKAGWRRRWSVEMRKWAGARQAKKSEREAGYYRGNMYKVTEVGNHEVGWRAVPALFWVQDLAILRLGTAEFGPWVQSLGLSWGQLVLDPGEIFTDGHFSVIPLMTSGALGVQHPTAIAMKFKHFQLNS